MKIEKGNDSSITSFMFLESHFVTQNISENEILVTLSYGTNIKSLTPQITTENTREPIQNRQDLQPCPA